MQKCVIWEIINHMKKNNYNVVCPQSKTQIETDPDYLNLSSGYIKRSLHIFPQQGKKAPWRNNQNFLKDIFQIRYGRIDDGEAQPADLAMTLYGDEPTLSLSGPEFRNPEFLNTLSRPGFGVS